MPTKYCIDGANITCYMIGEEGSGTECLIPKGVTPDLQNYDKIKDSLSPEQLFEDPYFPAEISSIAYNPKEKGNEIERIEEIEWLRPHEILKAKGVEGEPIFVDNGGDPDKVGIPDDVNQNQLGTCWFLCSMAEMSRLPDIFWMVVCKENLTQFKKEEYRGIFKFRFASFGRLVEVVIDDRIPFLRSENAHWSVQSDNPRVFWSALMEKAYAKLYSSYQAIQGGWIGDALQDFTGGVIDRYDGIGKMDKNKLWDIIVDATKAGFYMGASVCKSFKNTEEEQAFFGKTHLGNNHAYSLLTCKKVQIKGKTYRLLRLRNPWGNAFEFVGKFKEVRGKLWKKLDDETKKEFPAAEDGEFWMTLKEFVKNYEIVEVINLNPFGSGGKSLEELCEEVNFSRLLRDGEWKEENCFGPLGGEEEEGQDEEEGKNEEEGNEEEESKNEEEGKDDEGVDAGEDAPTGDGGDSSDSDSDGKNPEADDAPPAQSDSSSESEEDDCGCKNPHADGDESCGSSGSDDADSDDDKDDDKDAIAEEAKEYTEEDYVTFAKNPQIKFTVPENGLDEEGKSQVVVSLFQRYRRNMQKTGKGEVGIGMAVAKIEKEYPVTGSELFKRSVFFQDLDGGNFRSHTVRTSLTPGEYVVIPYTRKADYGGFTVIIFTKC